MTETKPTWLALVRDLMFASKILATAEAHRRAVKLVRDPAKLADESGDCLLVDLQLEGATTAASAWKSRTNGRVIGFSAHVDTQAIAEARSAGLDQVLSRGAFAARLEEILSQA